MNSNNLRIGFMGTPDFALGALRALCDAGHNIVCVYSQPPRPKGRGQKVQLSAVHEYAQEQGIPVFHPKSLKGQEAQDEFAAQNLDIAIVAAYGLLLPRAVLDAPIFGCVNIHGSILPRWRGASPIQHAIWKGDDESGVTLMQMDEGLDTGPMIATQTLPLNDEMMASDLHDALCDMGAVMIVQAMDDLVKTRTAFKHVQQDDAHATYAPLLKKTDGQIDWTARAQETDRQIRALNPWPGVYSDIGEARFKIKMAQLVDDPHDAPAGTLINKSGHVACGEGSTLQIKTIQPAGKKAMDFASAMNGGYLSLGDVFV